MQRDEQYDKALDQIKETYEPKILGKLRGIGEACRKAGLLTSDPINMCDDEFRWVLLVVRSDKPEAGEGFNVQVVIEEQRENEGGNSYGINFSIEITGFNGKIIGGVTPMNFTPYVWVDARVEEAVEGRWGVIEQLDDFPVATLIKGAK